MNHDDSIRLIKLIAPKISVEDAEILVELVEGCPLALKVIGKLIHNEYEDQVTDSLMENLRNSLISELDRPASITERFGCIMSFVLQRMRVSEVSLCGYYLSLFPGSFKHLAAIRVLPVSSPQECLLTFLSHSLLDKYVYHKVEHYKMHKLIQKYMVVTAEQDKLDTEALLQSFNERFLGYFSEYVLTYVQRLIHQNVSDEEKYYFSRDRHNIEYLVDILLNQTKLSNNNTRVLVALVYADMLKLDNLRMYFQHFMEQIIEVCNFLGTDECRHFYPNITSALLGECKCTYTEVLCMKSVPCNRPVWCSIMQSLNEHHRVFTNLNISHQEYLQRINWWYCSENHWIYTCILVHKLNTILCFVVIFIGLIRFEFCGLKGYLNKHVFICVYGVFYTMCSLSSIFAPTLALAFENVSTDLVEVLFLMINVAYVQLFIVLNKFKHSFILWNITVVPLVVLMCLNKQKLDDVLRLCLFNAFPYVFVIYNHSIEFKLWVRYVTLCSFAFSLAVVCMGDKGMFAIMSPYLVSDFLNTFALFLVKPLSTEYTQILSCLILLVNIIFSWNIFPICL